MEIHVKDGTVFDLKIQGFCSIMPCQLLCSYRHFKGVLRLHHQGQAVQGCPSGSFSRMCLPVDIVAHHRRMYESHILQFQQLVVTCCIILALWSCHDRLPNPFHIPLHQSPYHWCCIARNAYSIVKQTAI